MANTVRRQAARLAYSIERLAKAKESDISRSMIYEEITAGRLIARKLGRRTIVRRSDALRWLRSLPSLDPTECNGSRSTTSLDPDREQLRTAVEELDPHRKVDRASFMGQLPLEGLVEIAYEYLEAERIGYAIRLPPNTVLRTRSGACSSARWVRLPDEMRLIMPASDIRRGLEAGTSGGEG